MVMTRAAPMRIAASQNARAPPYAVTMTPAAAGPSTVAVRSTAAVRPVPRSMGTPAARVTDGMNTDLAAVAGPSPAPSTAISAISAHSGSASTAYSTGMAVMAARETRSPAMLTRRGPTRSISGPASVWTMRNGVIWQKAIRPVLPTLPVVVSTNHGTAMASIRLAAKEVAGALRPPTGHRAGRDSPPITSTKLTDVLRPRSLKDRGCGSLLVEVAGDCGRCPHPPGVGDELTEAFDVDVRQAQHHQRQPVVAGVGEEYVGLAEQQRLLLCLVADEQHGDVGPDEPWPARKALGIGPDEPLVRHPEVEAVAVYLDHVREGQGQPADVVGVSHARRLHPACDQASPPIGQS